MKTETYRSNDGEFEGAIMQLCPCCGGEPEIKFKGNNFTKKRTVTIKCKNCRLQRTDGAIYHSSEWVANKCIEHWNRRP